jgi:pyruvate, water dikinase
MYLSQFVQQQLPVARGFVLPVTEFQQQVQRSLSSAVPNPPWPLPQDLMQLANLLQQSLRDQELAADWMEALAVAARSLECEFVVIQASIDADDPDVAALWTTRICAVAELVPTLRELWVETFCARNLCYWQRQVESPAAIPLATIVQALPTTAVSGQLWIDAQKLSLHGFWGLQLADRALGEPNLVAIGDPLTGKLRSQKMGTQSVLHSLPSQLPAAFADAEPLMITGRDWLLPYAVGDLVQPCLNAVQVQSLLRLGQQIWQQWQQPLQMTWLWVDGEIVILAIQTGLLTSPWQSLPGQEEGDLRDRATSQNLIAAGLMAAPGEVTARAIVVADNRTILRVLPPESILVTTHLTPAWLPLIQQAAGLVTEQGGITSHGAILARELGIPAIIGVPQATQKIKSGDWLHLLRGKIYPGIGDANFATHGEMEFGQSWLTDLTTLPATITQRLAIVNQSAQVAELKDAAIDGIGLVRSEHLLLPHLAHQHPWKWLETPTVLRSALTEELTVILQAMAPRPVWYRTADWRSHELASLDGAELWPAEANPILGIHGAFSYQQFPEWLALELQAIGDLPEAERQHLRLILPFVRTVEEFQFCQAKVQQMGLADLPLWIMAEVPAVIFSLSEFAAAGVAGIVVGMNDLVQLVFAVDRDDPELSSFFNPNHPAMRQALQQLLRSAQDLKIPCHVCSLTDDAAFVEFLVGCGVTGIVANIQELGRLSRTIGQAEIAMT